MNVLNDPKISKQQVKRDVCTLREQAKKRIEKEESEKEVFRKKIAALKKENLDLKNKYDSLFIDNAILKNEVRRFKALARSRGNNGAIDKE